MNKIIFVALLALSLCQPSFLAMDDTVESNMETYEVFKGLMAGLSPEGLPDKCVEDIILAKRPISLIFDDFKRRIEEGEDFQKVLMENGMKLIQIRGILNDCNIMDLYLAFSNIFTEKGLVQISNQIKDNIPALLTAGNNLKSALSEKNDYKMGYNAGVIARLLINAVVK